MSARPFRPGIDTLLARKRHWIKGARVGIISHPAALDASGAASTHRMASDDSCSLVAIFGPEHGFFGNAAAGAKVRSSRHPLFDLPVFSLYGEQRRPSAAALANLDVLLFDLQNLAARPYTYIATLRYVMEAAAAHGKRLIVADRPVSLPSVIDGPLTDKEFGSFVAAVDTTMAYGMTPGESANWLRSKLDLDIELNVAAMQGYHREAHRQPHWPPWIPPSPQIRSWESAQCYLATVFAEALPSIDNGRDTNLAFQVFGAPWLDVDAVKMRLQKARLPGVTFHPCLFVSAGGNHAGKRIQALRMVVTSPHRFRPVSTSVHILSALQQVHGRSRIWRSRNARPDFFDKLYATDTTRRQLRAGTPPEAIVASWRQKQTAFRRERRKALLYGRESGTA